MWLKTLSVLKVILISGIPCIIHILWVFILWDTWRPPNLSELTYKDRKPPHIMPSFIKSVNFHFRSFINKKQIKFLKECFFFKWNQKEKLSVNLSELISVYCTNLNWKYRYVEYKKGEKRKISKNLLNSKCLS